MDRKGFGELIASLREELGWTQAHLARAVGLDESAVSIIERGVRKHFDPELLYRLANALQLTSLERKQFLLAASGVDDNQTWRSGDGTGFELRDTEQILQNLTALAGRLYAPAYLLDCYGEVIAANAAAIDLFQAPLERFSQLSVMPGGLTMLHLLFSEDLGFRGKVLENWDALAVTSVRAFREATLRYRASPYFKYLMGHLGDHRAYPAFDRYWRRAAVEEDRFNTLNSLIYRDNVHGQLNYCISAITVVTPYGELYLSQCSPMDARTAATFHGIMARMGAKAFRFARWPEKTMV